MFWPASVKNKMSTEPFLGTWRVTEVVPFSSHPEILHLEGINWLCHNLMNFNVNLHLYINLVQTCRGLYTYDFFGSQDVQRYTSQFNYVCTIHWDRSQCKTKSLELWLLSALFTIPIGNVYLSWGEVFLTLNIDHTSWYCYKKLTFLLQK